MPPTTLQQILAKQSKTSAPTDSSSNNSALQAILAKGKTTPAQPQPTQQPQQSFASAFFGGARNALAKPVLNATQDIDTALNQTVGRVATGAASLVNKNVKPFSVPSDSSINNPSSPAGQTAQAKVNAPDQGVGGVVGDVVGTVAPYTIGLGEEEAIAKGTSMIGRVAAALGKDVDQIVPKAAGFLTKLGIKTAAQAPVAIAQTNSVGKGLAQSAAFSTGEEALGAGIKGVKSLFKSGEQKLVDSLTPYLTPSKVEKGIVGAAGKGEEFSASEISSVKKSVQAVKDVASALGKKASTIVRSGVKTAEGNAARLGKAIGDYSNKIVSPMLKNNPVPFNFEDLRGAFANVMPKEVLNNPEATAAFKRIGESFLNVIGKSIKGTGRVLSEDDFNDIWNSRKVMDNIITDERGANAFGTQARTGVDAAAKAYRGAFKQFLSDSYRYAGQMGNLNKFHANVSTLEQKFGRSLNEDELKGLQKQMGITLDEGKKELADQWDKHMNNMSSLYDGIANIATKAKKEYGKGYAELFAKAHPITTKAAKGVGVGAAGALGAGGVYEGGKTLLGQ